MTKKFKIIILIELLLVIAFSGVLFLQHSGGSYEIPVSFSEWSPDSEIELDNEWQIVPPKDGINDSTNTVIESPQIHLPKGTYTLDIWYRCTGRQSVYPYARDKYDRLINYSEFYLGSRDNHVSYMFSVDEDLDNFELRFNYNGEGTLQVYGIQINANNNGKRVAILSLIAICALIDLIILYRSVSKRWQNRMLILLSLTLISSLPLFFHGINSLDKQDIAFHLMRISGLSQGMRDGQFPVRINTPWISGYGYPVSIFYGDILLYFPAVLHLLGVPLYQAYKIFVFAMNLGTAAIAMFCFDRMFRNRIIGALTSLVYVTGSYRLVDIFVRSAVGEYCAIMFFPLIALSLWNIYTTANSTLKENVKNGIYMAIGMSGILTAHILSAEMAAFTMLIVFLMMFRKSFRMSSIRTYVIGVLGTLLLSVFFLVPFVDYMLNVPVKVFANASTLTKMVQRNGVSWGDYFAFFNNPFGESMQMLCTPGPVLMIALVAALYIWIRGRASKKVKVLSIASLLMLWLASDTFPWNSLAIHSKIFNFLAEVQFPWRYVALAILFLTILFGVMLKERVFEDLFHLDGRRVVQLICAVTITATCLFASYYQDKVDKVTPTDTANLNPVLTLMNREYIRSKIEDGKVVMADLNRCQGQFASGGADYLEVINRKGTSIDLIVQTGDEAAEITAPMFNYKGYEVYDDENNQYEVTDSDNFCVSFVIPPDFEGTVHIRFISPWYWNASILVSAITAILMALYLWMNRDKKTGENHREMISS